ncbi:MAG TPA: cation transporter [Acholeplasmataceae bacterium]|nr:cation transporter [Acholeplasmataceae bacterium]
MYKLLIKLFIKDYNEINNNKVRQKYGLLSSIFGIITNVFLCIIKVIIGILATSIAIIADGINNLTDGASSITTLIAFKMSSKEPDSEHPFGHERLEYVSGLIVSILIIVIGILFAESSIKKIISHGTINIDNFNILIIILLISILIKLWQFFAYRYTGKKIKSHSLLATATDSFNDVIATSVVLISIIFYKFTSINIDGYMGLGVALFIIYSGIKLVKEATSPLLGEAPSKDLVNLVTKKIKEYEGVLGIHDLVIHSYGPARTYITVHVEVDADIDISKSHDLIDQIEREFLESLNINLVIHMDPINLKDPLTQKLKEKVEKIIMEIDENIRMHDFRIVKGVTHTNIIFDIVVPFDFYIKDIKIINLISEEIKKIDNHYNPIITVDYENLS